MKKLVRIKLINWHLFANQTVEIHQNCLLSGENGAGKSTFLDALQYVLTGGKAKFNTAANNSAKRNLEGYIRCKLGMENKTFLRSQDVTSHIALEFLDDMNQNRLILGAIIEMNKTGRIYEHFYLLKDYEISDDLYIEKKIIRGYALFKKYMQTIGANVTFCDTKEKTRNLFLSSLEIRNEKYIELIPKALAFKPINELNKFVYDFLLNEKNVSIDELRQNVRSYREFENLVETLQEKETHLNEIYSNYQIYQKNKKLETQYKQLRDYNHYQQVLRKEHKLSETLSFIKEKIKQTHEKQFSIDQHLLILNEEIEHLKQVLNTNQAYSYLQDIDRRIKENTLKGKKLQESLNHLQTIISHEKKLANYVYQNINQHACLKEPIDFFSTTQLQKVIHFYDQLKDELLITISQLKVDKKQLEENITNVNEQLFYLERRQISFDHHIMRLKTLIEEEIKRTTNKISKVFAFCELIEVRDETWRHALEGYLNSQRFDLIVEPQYFDLAVQVYETHKQKEQIYGVGIVNTNALSYHDHFNENSLASKLYSNHHEALKYVYVLLNQVTCCDQVEDLKQHRTAITKTCMVYKNHTVRHIKEAIYRKPFIGQNAIKMQLNYMIEQKRVIEHDLAKLQKEISLKEFYLQRLKASQLIYIHEHISQFDEFKIIQKQVEELHKKRVNYRINDNLQQVNEELKEKKSEVEKLIEEKNQLLLQEGKLSGELDNKTYELKLLREEKDHTKVYENKEVIQMYGDLSKQFEMDLNKIIQYCEKQKTEIENNIKEVHGELIKNMNQYNIKYHCGFSPTIDGLKQYEDELKKIRDYELIKYQTQAKEARINCEIAFKEQFIYKLRENILNAQNELDYLNQALNGKKFGGDEYEFVYKASLDKQYQHYYFLIMNELEDLNHSLFTEGISNENQVLLKELFDQLVVDSTDQEAEAMLAAFCDYRNYMSYDIKVHHKNGETSYFSKVSREKSGGETQTPFYVVIAASFEQIITSLNNLSSPACFVMFDEAFNNMDESRIQAMMEFYSQLNIQLMISVPPQRIETIIQNVNTTLVVMKDDNQSFIETFTYKDKK